MATITSLTDEKHVLDLDWGKIQWLCGQEIDPECEMTFGMVYIHAGAENNKHYHPNCEEFIFVLSGECDHTLGDESFHLKPGMMLRIPRGVWHNAKATSWEPCRMMIMYSAPDRQTRGHYL
ncbi:cupin domain-containing protein [Paenibacillus qinlingensis]|uniref:Quercetin dioxygenase-like cupin family protein n=1 Tax=Paenibacillus qinlingensis TaxID=1837343 RepID=A0ABU1NNR1_9BACL|nr:cupin domain-containing protein [Paenibacillus qinlingensis]MDR6549104.1 quercetin dioxygenase-like cupin family protein [Paenibacillus qinlingensis]